MSGAGAAPNVLGQSWATIPAPRENSAVDCMIQEYARLPILWGGLSCAGRRRLNEGEMPRLQEGRRIRATHWGRRILGEDGATEVVALLVVALADEIGWVSMAQDNESLVRNW